MSYTFATTLGGDVDAIEEKVTEALKEEGFGVLTRIDVEATLKKKLGIQKRPYRILGACNPRLASKALDAEPDIGLLLPCNVAIRSEADDRVTVSFMDPESVLTLVERDEVAALASDVKARLVGHAGNQVNTRDPQMLQDKAHCAGNGPILSKHCNAVLGHLRVSRRAMPQATLDSVALA